LVGRARALEIILGAQDIDAKTAEHWGFLNRAMAEDEIDTFVQQLARRIASFPPAALSAAKRAVDLASLPLGGQTREVELRVSELAALSEPRAPRRRALPTRSRPRPKRQTGPRAPCF
jgi:enoyl-CoA hydratase/carnithine racemase